MLRNLASVTGTGVRYFGVGALQRSKCSCALAPSSLTISKLPSASVRQYSYYKSNVEESPDKYTKYEKSFDEWKYVEKLIPQTHVPAPPTDPNQVLPSGWKAPSPPKDCPYIIRRTRNHQVPVYLKVMDRGMVRHTIIRRVEGNIWQLEKDIGNFLQKEVPQKTIITRTHEICRQVIIKGDLYDRVKQWAVDQGF